MQKKNGAILIAGLGRFFQKKKEWQKKSLVTKKWKLLPKVTICANQNSNKPAYTNNATRWTSKKKIEQKKLHIISIQKSGKKINFTEKDRVKSPNLSKFWMKMNQMTWKIKWERKIEKNDEKLKKKW